jgi:hypothetical protein
VNTSRTTERKSVATENSAENDQEAPGRSGTTQQTGAVHGQLATCLVVELHPHPSYSRHHLTVPASQLSALAEQGDLAFREPLVITRDRTILDGYARWELAKQQGRLTLPCIEYELNEAEALHWLLQKHRGSKGLNAFSRTLLALELEPWLKEKARSNQRVGGQSKGSSKLTEAERVDVRSEVAAAAGVSVGNVSKVKRLMIAPPEIMQALFSGEISIHRAWLCIEESPEKQLEKFSLYQMKRGIRKTIKALISQHMPGGPPTVPDLGTLLKGLSAVEAGEPGSVSVEVVKVPGKRIFVSEDLLQALRSQQELPLT